MDGTTDILRGELERLFTLDEMTSMSKLLLALEPSDVGGVDTKATFARALAERCVVADRVDALLDVLEASRPDVDPRVREVGSVLGRSAAKPGQSLGGFTLVRKLGEGDLGAVFVAEYTGPAGAIPALTDEGGPVFVKVIHADAARD